MKLQEGIKILQEKYPKHIILVKNGLFYNAIGEDAIALSKEFGLVKICFAKEICKIGINENKINEFTVELIKKNYNYILRNIYNEILDIKGIIPSEVTNLKISIIDKQMAK